MKASVVWRSDSAGNGSVSIEGEAPRKLQKCIFFKQQTVMFQCLLREKTQAIKPDAEGYYFEWHHYY